MAKTFTSLLAVLSLCLALRIKAVPLKPGVPEERQQRNNEAEKPGSVETIDQIILKSYGGIEAEEKAEELRMEKGEETNGYDLVLTPEQTKLLHNKRDDSELEMAKRRKPTFITLWTNGIVPYDFGELDSKHHALMREAFDEWETHTCVRFVPAQSHHQHKIRFTNGGGCYSYLGMTSWSEQEVSLSFGCHHKRTYLHELGHALGLVHEHQLPQRDSFIRIEENNVTPKFLSQFDKYDTRQIPEAKQVPYSLESIMHYGKYAFSKGYPAQTIHALDKSQEDLMGTSESLASSDIKAINIMYNC